MDKRGLDFIVASLRDKYSYNFTWLSRPIIQYPQDVIAMQEIIWRVNPDLIVETGIAHGGSLIFSASMLLLLDAADAVKQGGTVELESPKRKVVGVDIEVRPHNRAAIEGHPFAGYIQMIEGSSVDPMTVQQVMDAARGHKTVLVCLDSNHTHEHVLLELQAYSPLVSVGSYCVVFDTIIDDLGGEAFADRPWGVGNNPKTAVREFIQQHHEFAIDSEIPQKLLITVAPDGFLKRMY